MKSQKGFNIRMSDRLLTKLRQYADVKDKSMTQVIKDLIEELPETQNASTT